MGWRPSSRSMQSHELQAEAHSVAPATAEAADDRHSHTVIAMPSTKDVAAWLLQCCCPLWSPWDAGLALFAAVWFWPMVSGGAGACHVCWAVPCHACG